MNNKNNEQYNENRTHQRRNSRHGHYKKRSVKVHAKTTKVENKEFESVKQVVEILSDGLLEATKKLSTCASVIPACRLREIPHFQNADGCRNGVGYALVVINKFFPLVECLPTDKANEVLEILSSAINDDSEEEERCYDEIR